MNNVNTPYDDVFRTLLTDSSFLVVRDGISKSYHIECQSTPDGTMAIRMFEYDSQIALQDSLFERGILTVNFPHSAILYLRHASGTPSQFAITINTPGGQISYSILILKVQTYSIDTIFEKRLYFLIPFYIFTYESQLKSIENDSASLDALCNEYAIIKARLETLSLQGSLTEYTLKTICDMTDKVITSLAHKYEKIKKEVSTVMGGKVLEYEAKTIYREGIKEGIDQGIMILVKSLKKVGCTTEMILSEIIDNFNLSEEEAKAYIE